MSDAGSTTAAVVDTISTMVTTNEFSFFTSIITPLIEAGDASAPTPPDSSLRHRPISVLSLLQHFTPQQGPSTNLLMLLLYGVSAVGEM